MTTDTTAILKARITALEADNVTLKELSELSENAYLDRIETLEAENTWLTQLLGSCLTAFETGNDHTYVEYEVREKLESISQANGKGE